MHITCLIRDLPWSIVKTGSVSADLFGNSLSNESSDGSDAQWMKGTMVWIVTSWSAFDCNTRPVETIYIDEWLKETVISLDSWHATNKDKQKWVGGGIVAWGSNDDEEGRIVLFHSEAWQENYNWLKDYIQQGLSKKSSTSYRDKWKSICLHIWIITNACQNSWDCGLLEFIAFIRYLVFTCIIVSTIFIHLIIVAAYIVIKGIFKHITVESTQTADKDWLPFVFE